MSTRYDDYMKVKLTEKEVAQVRTLIEERWPPAEIDTEFPKWVGDRIAKNAEQEKAFLKEDQDSATSLDDTKKVARR